MNTLISKFETLYNDHVIFYTEIGVSSHTVDIIVLYCSNKIMCGNDTLSFYETQFEFKDFASIPSLEELIKSIQEEHIINLAVKQIKYLDEQ